MLKNTAFILSVIVLLASCKKNIPENAIKYGVGYDSARLRLGLPTFKHNQLDYERSGRDYAEFKAPVTIIKPMLEYKSVFWTDSIGLYLERNFFKGPAQQELQILYGYKCFKDGDWNTLGFGCYLRQHQGDTSTKITKRQADSVLRKWGVELK